MQKARVFRIVLSGASDVERELEQLEKEIKSLSRVYERRGIKLEPVYWKTSAPLGLNPDGGGQVIIDQSLDMPNADVFIGLY